MSSNPTDFFLICKRWNTNYLSDQNVKISADIFAWQKQNFGEKHNMTEIRCWLISFKKAIYIFIYLYYTWYIVILKHECIISFKIQFCGFHFVNPRRVSTRNTFKFFTGNTLEFSTRNTLEFSTRNTYVLIFCYYHCRFNSSSLRTGRLKIWYCAFIFSSFWEFGINLLPAASIHSKV